MDPKVEAFFDHATYTVTYVVANPEDLRCAIVDSVLGYDPKSGRTSTAAADQVIEYVRANDLSVDWILETHAHADHLTAAPYLKAELGGQTAIGSHIVAVQSIFKDIFNTESEFATDGSQFDHLLVDGETFNIGSIIARAIHTPGHTPACMTYVIGDSAFVGDTLFMPDYGTARVDFPGGDAATLYQSIQKILALPEHTRLFMCHDYLAPGRDEYEWETTVADERANNVHVGRNKPEAEFVAMREARDKTLEMPTLLLPSVQVNIRAGAFPPVEDNDVSYLKIPVDAV